MTFSRYSVTMRCVATVACFMVVASGGGLPMCVSLIARATTPCAMHTDHKTSQDHHLSADSVNAAPSGHETCHGDAQSGGCATGGVCPGNAAGAISNVPVLGIGAGGDALVFPPVGPHVSFVAPPLPPPPQA